MPPRTVTLMIDIDTPPVDGQIPAELHAAFDMTVKDWKRVAYVLVAVLDNFEQVTGIAEELAREGS